MKVIKRKSMRAVLLTPENEILLIKLNNPKESWIGWITPGGGLDPGESELQGLQRELYEELGFSELNSAVKIWKRFHSFPWNGTTVEQHEIFYLIKTRRFEPVSKVNLTETEMLDFEELRWWSLEELKTSKEVFAPSSLAQYLELLINSGPPFDPIDVGV